MDFLMTAWCVLLVLAIGVVGLVPVVFVGGVLNGTAFPLGYALDGLYCLLVVVGAVGVVVA